MKKKSQTHSAKKNEIKTERLLPSFIMDQKVLVSGGFYKGKIGTIRDFFPGEKEEKGEKILKPSLYLIITTLYDSIYVEEQDITSL